MDWFDAGMYFLLGFLFHKFCSYIINLGSHVILFKQLEMDCLRMLIAMSRSLEDHVEIKSLLLKESGRDEKYVNVQRKVDLTHVNSMRNTAIRNFVGEFPKTYRHRISYNNWKTALQYFHENNK